jgi:hypothetical protein
MRCRLISVCLALVGLAMGLVWSASQASAEPCMIMANVHNRAWTALHRHRLTQCNSGQAGCKCVSCYNFNGSVSSACYPLLAPIPR